MPPDDSAPNEAKDQPLPQASKTSTLMLRGSVLQLVLFAGNLATGFLLMPLLIHGLGERTYGLFALIGTIVGQLGLFDLGFMSTTERYMAGAIARGDREASVAIYSTSIALFVFLGFVVFAVVSAIALATPLWLKNPLEVHEFEIALLISGLNLAWLFPFAVMQGALAAAYRSDASTIAQIANTVVRIGLTVAAVFAGYGIIGVAAAYFLACFVQRVMMGFMMHKYLPGIGFRLAAVNRKTLKEMVGFGRFVFLLKMFDQARYRIHNLLIAPMLGIVAVTHYSVALRLADYFEALIYNISGVSRPVYAAHFARGEHHILKEKFLVVARLSSGICCLFASEALVFGRPFIRLWLGPGFDDSYLALSILVVGMFFALLQTPSRDVLRAIYKHQVDALTNGIEVACNLVLTLLLLPVLGIIGAALGTTIPMVVVKAFILPRYVCRTLELSLTNYYLTVIQPAALTTVFSLACYFLFPVNKIPNLMILAAAMTAFATTLTVMLLVTLPSLDKLTLVQAFGRPRLQRIAGGRLLLRALGV